MKCKYHNCSNEAKPRKNALFCSYACKNTYFVDFRRWQLKLKAIVYKGGKCQTCGYSKCPTALDFHHVDPDTKEFAISKKPHTRSWARIQKEIDKCELLCANCHREKEFELRSANKPFIVELLKDFKL